MWVFIGFVYFFLFFSSPHFASHPERFSDTLKIHSSTMLFLNKYSLTYSLDSHANDTSSGGSVRSSDTDANRKNSEEWGGRYAASSGTRRIQVQPRRYPPGHWCSCQGAGSKATGKMKHAAHCLLHREVCRQSGHRFLPHNGIMNFHLSGPRIAICTQVD